jgi:hypothetical protein
VTLIERLEAMLADATPGPWEQWEEHPIVYAGPLTKNEPECVGGYRRMIAECDDEDAEYDANDDDEGEYIDPSDEGFNNAALIAAAVNALPALLAVAKAAKAYVRPGLSHGEAEGLLYRLENELEKLDEVKP